MARRRSPAAPRRRPLALLEGPLPALPRALDRVADWWAGRPPRLRVAVLVLGLALLIGVSEVRVRAVEDRWGGTPVPVLVASRDLGVGETPEELRPRRLPPRAVPPGALTAVPDGARLALALPEGGVLTAAHVDPRGPAAGLPADLRAVPVAVEDGWGIVAGGWVDVWVLGDGTADSRLVARSRPVLEVRDEDQPTALVGLASAEVEAVTMGLAGLRLLLAHAPPPGEDTAPPVDGVPPVNDDWPPADDGWPPADEDWPPADEGRPPMDDDLSADGTPGQGEARP